MAYTVNIPPTYLELQTIRDILKVLTEGHPVTYKVKAIPVMPSETAKDREPVFRESILGLYEKVTPRSPKMRFDLELSLYHHSGWVHVRTYMQEHYSTAFECYNVTVRECESAVIELLSGAAEAIKATQPKRSQHD